MFRHLVRRGHRAEPPNTAPQSPVPERNRLTRRTVLLAVAGVILTTAMIQALRGSYLPTSLFVLAGLLAPVPVAHLLIRLTRARVPFPGVISVLSVVAMLTVVAISGKFPNRSALFSRAFGTAPDQTVVLGSATRGWYDGSISVLRFRAPDSTIRGLIPPTAVLSEPADSSSSPDSPVTVEQHEMTWRRGTLWGSVVDQTLAIDPGWKDLHTAIWRTMPPHALTISTAWDAATGEAVLVVADDPELR